MQDNTKENITEKLKMIGLDLEKIPDFLKDFKAPDFRPTKRFDNKEYLVYKYIPVKDIQIMITRSNRLTDIKEKYKLAKPISEYLDANSEEKMEDFAIFLKMINDVQIQEIQEVAEKQKALNDGIPYKVRYEKNYLWQIYYSEYSNQYFMLAPSDDAEYGGLFYLLKEQIALNKKKKGEYIYVPVSNIEPGDEILRKSERSDIENYMWVFTKRWPNIYEVTEKDGASKIVIVGDVEVYPSVLATYHVELANREDAYKFYKELKALFILQTELQEYYTFKCQIDENGALQFLYKDEQIDYEKLSEFIKKEYEEAQNRIEKSNKELKEMKAKLCELKEDAQQKERDFLDKQREISTYLQYKKTFFGRVRYFFSKKKNVKNDKTEQEEKIEETEEKVETTIEQKENYTIEDLVTVYASYAKTESELKNVRLDADALELKIKNLNKKIENATLYINEIDSHKKSIFEFWKFSSKDDITALNPGEEEETEVHEKTLRKIFDYETDREDVTMRIDKQQRTDLTKEQLDSLFVANSEILPILNKIKTLVKITDKKLNEVLDSLKEKAEQEEKYSTEVFDIFGALSEEKTKIKILGKNKHRETEKNRMQILGINSDTSLQEFKEKLKSIESNLEESFKNTKNIIDMPIYKAVPADEKLDLYGFEIYSMNAEEELKKIKENEDECNLYKINLQENMPAIFYTNIIFFDNNNKTLPLGMEKSNDVMINSAEYEFTLRSMKTVYTNQYFTENADSSKLITKKVNIYEYDIETKKCEVKNDK